METPISQMESQCKQRHTEIVTCNMHAHTKVSREAVLHLHVVVHGTQQIIGAAFILHVQLKLAC